MSIQLFDSKKRISTDSIRRTESDYSYWNNSARPLFSFLRDLWEEWFEHYPRDYATDLRSRFASDDNLEHGGASFELLCHEILRKLGCCVSIHENTSDSSVGNPDFLVTGSNGERFYFEATLSANNRAMKDSPILAEIEDAIDSIESPYFYFSFEFVGTAESQIKLSRLRHDVQQWINGVPAHPPETNQGRIQGTVFSYGKLQIEIDLIPRGPSTYGVPGLRAIGSSHTRGGHIDSKSPIRTKLNKKKKQFAALDAPLVIAINSYDSLFSERKAIRTLYGQQVGKIEMLDGKWVDTPGDWKWDGEYGSPSNPRKPLISGVLAFIKFKPWNLGSDRPKTLYCEHFNPTFPPPRVFRTLSWVELIGNDPKISSGTALTDVLGIDRTMLDRALALD